MNQNSSEKQPLIEYRMQRARETLQDAHLLLEQGGSTGSVINRAYYAMFYAALALLTTIGKGSSKHSGVIALLDQHFIGTGMLSKDLSRAIHKAFDLRQIGDYRELIELSFEHAQEMLASAQLFYAEVEKFLDQQK